MTAFEKFQKKHRLFDNLSAERFRFLSPILIAKVVEKKKHENADKLFVVKLDIRLEEPIQVVTGADNFQEGDLVPFLGVNNIVPGFLFSKGESFILEKKPLRGEMSEGMILAEDEIGIGEDHSGIVVLDVDESLVGESLLEVITGEQIQAVMSYQSDLIDRMAYVTSISSNGGELVGLSELPGVMSSQDELVTYDGFEPSGQMHIAQGIIRAINTNKMIAAGFKFRMYVADWFGYLNNKMGGDMEKIQKVGKYFVEIWRAAGMDLDNTEFLWTSDVIDDKQYWETVMRVAKSTTLNRILRTTEIMGRSETDNLTAANIIYPAMQTTDIFHVMKCQVTQLGLDQRKVNMLARQVGPELGFWKPIVLSHGMLQGLGKPIDEMADAKDRAIEMKMSKSKPDTAIFVTDTRKDIERKIGKAYCPEGEVADNPILDYCKQVIFQAKYLKGQENILDNGFEVKRAEEFGGDVSYQTYQDLEDAYVAKELFPLDLKNAVVDYLDRLIKPIKDHFENNAEAKALLKEVQSFQVTR